VRRLTCRCDAVAIVIDYGAQSRNVRRHQPQFDREAAARQETAQPVMDREYDVRPAGFRHGRIPTKLQDLAVA
jgi:hypothetical protein